MGKIWRLLLLALLLNASLATITLARTVYLADGGVIQAQKVWQEEGKIYVLLNRDSLIHFSPEEINLKKTFAKKRQSAATKSVAKNVTVPAATAKVSPPPATPPATTVPAVVAKKPAPRPVVVPPPETASETMGLAFLGAGLLFILILIASFWKVFEKAGQAGWKSLIPIYNLFVLLQIAGCPSWWLLMLFIPVVNIYFMVVMHIRLAEKFGKEPLFGFALCFLGFIFFPILAFGPATYGGREETFSFDEDEFPE